MSNKTEMPPGLTKNGWCTPGEPIEVDQLQHITKYINTYFEPSKSIYRKRSSYGLKHLVERNIGIYISNGEFIAAMLLCGYQSYKETTWNCYFKIKNRKEALL